MPQVAGLPGIELSGMLRGDIGTEQSNVDLFSPGMISVYFFFDTNRRMAGHLVDPFIYSL